MSLRARADQPQDRHLHSVSADISDQQLQLLNHCGTAVVIEEEACASMHQTGLAEAPTVE
jgi:hypothetical protein